MTWKPRIPAAPLKYQTLVFLDQMNGHWVMHMMLHCFAGYTCQGEVATLVTVLSDMIADQKVCQNIVFINGSFCGISGGGIFYIIQNRRNTPDTSLQTFEGILSKGPVSTPRLYLTSTIKRLAR